MTTSMKLTEALAKAVERVKSMTTDQRRAMCRAQRASFIRAMTTGCEHGVRDFEQCPECRLPHPKG